MKGELVKRRKDQFVQENAVRQHDNKEKKVSECCHLCLKAMEKSFQQQESSHFPFTGGDKIEQERKQMRKKENEVSFLKS